MLPNSAARMFVAALRAARCINKGFNSDRENIFPFMVTAWTSVELALEGSFCLKKFVKSSHQVLKSAHSNVNT